MKENEIEEGKVKKGGVNSKPTAPPPEPPKGQGGSGALLLCCNKCGEPIPATLSICNECASKCHLQAPHVSAPLGIDWPPNDLITESDTSVSEEIQKTLDAENANLIPDDERIILDDFSHWPKNEGWPRNEEILRELLWMEHQCEGKYGDDGEMQCGKCLIDFRRDSAKDIASKTKKKK